MRPSAIMSARDRFGDRLGLTTAGILTFVAAAVALIASIAIFGDTTEDVTRHNGLTLHDAADLRVFTSHRSAGLVDAAKALTQAGAVPVMGAIAVLAAAVLWWRGSKVVVAAAPVGAFVLAAGVAGVTKVVVNRTRPPVALHLVNESDASFPSGHSTNSTAVFLTIAFVVAVFILRRPLARVAAVAVAIVGAGAIGASRLVLGVHWPSDVLAGMALGLGTALAVTMIVTLVARATPRQPRAEDGAVRRIGLRLYDVLAFERRPPRGELHAA